MRTILYIIYVSTFAIHLLIFKTRNDQKHVRHEKTNHCQIKCFYLKSNLSLCSKNIFSCVSLFWGTDCADATAKVLSLTSACRCSASATSNECGGGNVNGNYCYGSKATRSCKTSPQCKNSSMFFSNLHYLFHRVYILYSSWSFQIIEQARATNCFQDVELFFTRVRVTFCIGV